MSPRNRALQAEAPESEQPLRDPHLAHQAGQIGKWPAETPFPALLGDGDLMRVFGIGHSRYAILKKLGRFKQLEVHPQMVGTTRYSGLLVRRYCAGEWTEARSFGRGRRSA